jgi:isochorismate synthase
LNLLNKISSYYTQNKPFVAYRKPNDKLVSGYFMSDNFLCFTDDYSQSGFVFSPFDTNKKGILFPLEKSSIEREQIEINEIQNYKIEEQQDLTAQESHIQIVEKAIKAINESDLQKIVISRKEVLNLSTFDLISIFKNLLFSYTSAFVYVWYHPKIGLWFGATPETLLKVNENIFKTMSLAGTQEFVNQEKVVWKNKELEEQQLVTTFIEHQLQPIAEGLEIDKTETIRAGDLLHLRTKVEGVLNKEANLKALIKALHPTPAVCGLPREKAKKFIVTNELYDRSYYTGFLGELNIKDTESDFKKTELFVNLRCMSVENDIANVYVGGGITKDSDAKKEWLETVSKSKTMKKVL